MNHWEITRLICYAVAAPARLYLALAMLRNHLYSQGVFYLSISLLFGWFVFETTLASTGVSTRAYRFVATPAVVAAGISAVWMVWQMLSWRRKAQP